jgi:cell division septation protein DedD
MNSVSPARSLILLLALVLGVASSALVACGSSDNQHLLSAARADRLQSQLDDVRDAVDNHDCEVATNAARKLQDEIESLPRDTDPRLRERLQEGAANLTTRATEECQETETTTTETVPTQTETTPTETTPTETTPTETTPTETTPTETTPTEPTPTVPDNGGSTVPPDETTP